MRLSSARSEFPWPCPCSLFQFDRVLLGSPNRGWARELLHSHALCFVKVEECPSLYASRRPHEHTRSPHGPIQPAGSKSPMRSLMRPSREEIAVGGLFLKPFKTASPLHATNAFNAHLMADVVVHQESGLRLEYTAATAN